MKNPYPFKSFSRPTLFILLILSMFLAQRGNGQEKFWIPSDPPAARYKIDARIDLSNNIVEGKETIILHNSSSEPISLLAVDWAISGFRSIEIDISGKSLPLLNTAKKLPISSPLLYALPKPVMSGSRIKINIKFSKGGLTGGDKKEIKLIKWYPRLWWDSLPAHDVFEVKLDIPAGYALAASGRLNGATGYYENAGVRTFGVYLGKDLKTDAKEVEGVLITSLFTENGAECARLCLETAADVVKFYKSWLGFYPFKFLYIIPGASRPMGGYPFASGIVVIHGQERFKSKPLLHWKWITAHEIGHQYWGEYVMDNDMPSWLWIGMGIYADRRYTIFRNLGLDKHKGLMKRYLEGVRKHYDTTIDIPPAQYRKIKYDYNNVVIHGKGYSIISALEFVQGKELFEKIYKKCLKDYGRKCLGYKEFSRVCEVESGENLKWFFDQWVRSNKYLSYQIVSKESEEKNGIYISKIKVESSGSLQMAVPIKAVFEDGSSQIKLTNRLFRVNELKFESRSKLKEAILDPDNKLALLETPLETTSEELSKTISQLPWTDAGEDALRAYKKAKNLKLDNVAFWFKLGLTLFDGGYHKESFDAFERLIELNPPQLNHFAALVWMGHLQDLFGNREEALKYYNEALKHDVGGTMRHDQWGMKIDRQWVEERLKTPFKWGRSN